MQYRIGFFCLLALAVVAFSGCGGGGGGAGATTAAALGAAATPSDLGAAAATRSIHMAAFGPMGADPDSAAQRFECHTANACETANIRRIRSAHGKSLVLLYEIAAAAAEADWARDCPNDPVGYYWISQNHPEWFLRDAGGKLMRANDYSYLVWVDPGIPEYQKAWAQKAIEKLRSAGADGVMIDNATSRYDWSFPTVRPQKYPDQQSYEAAIDSFIRYVSQEIKAAGFLVLGNGASEPWNSGIWSTWITMLDGRVSEFGGVIDENMWNSLRESYQQWPDKYYIQYLPDPKKYIDQARFALVSFLIWQGPNSYLGLGYCADPELPYDPLMDVRLGEPAGQCEQVTDMTYRRSYQCGEVFLNASLTRSAQIQVTAGGKDLAGNPVAEGTRTLGPREWLILVR